MQKLKSKVQRYELQALDNHPNGYRNDGENTVPDSKTQQIFLEAYFH